MGPGVVVSNTHQVATHVFRASRSTYWVVLFIWLAPALLVASATVQHLAIESAWQMTGFVTTYGVLLWVWVRKFRLEIGDGKIAYTSLFGGHREIRAAEIESVVRSIGIVRYRDRFSPPLRLEIIPKGTSTAQKVVINAKVFDRKSVDCLLQYLEEENCLTPTHKST